MQDFLTVQEACALTKWTRATLYSKISRRQIPHLKLGRSIRFRRSDLVKLFREVPALRPLRPAGEEGGGR